MINVSIAIRSIVHEESHLVVKIKNNLFPTPDLYTVGVIITQEVECLISN